MSNPTEQLLMTLGSHWALLNIVVVSLTILFMCKKKKPAAAAGTTGTTAPSAPAGDKKPEEIKEDKKEENSKEKEEKKSEKKEGSKKSKKEKSKKSKKEEKKEEKKEDEGGEKKEEGGEEKKDGEEKKETSKKEAGSKKASGSKKRTSKKKDGSKLVDIDEHASELKEKTDNPSPINGEKKEDDGGEKKDEKKEEHKLLIDQKELKFTNPEGKEEILKLNLNNKTGLRIGVKIKCSDNTLFRVDPVFSFLEKDANCVVEISRNAGNPKQDKLSVVYVEAPPDLNDAQAVFKVVQTVAANKIKTISVDLNAEAAAK